MVSVDSSMHRILSGNDEARRVLYLNNSIHPPPHLSMATPRDGTLTYLRAPVTYSSVQQQSQQSHSSKRPVFTGQSSSGPSTAVSRRNARERKRVRLVNLGFSTLRERVPPGAKNKKLSKVETLRAAIEYIRQLQTMLGHTDQQMYDEPQNFQRLIDEENYGMDECSSAASSEEVATPLRSSCGPAGGSGDLSPVSSHPSDYSLVSSPYTNQNSQEDHILDMGMWFS